MNTDNQAIRKNASQPSQVFALLKAHPTTIYTSPEVAELLKISPGSASAVLSGLYKREAVKRTGTSHKYYWQFGKGDVAPTIVKPAVVAPAPVRKRRRSNRQDRGGLLITFEYGKKQSITFTLIEARDLYHQLEMLLRKE